MPSESELLARLKSAVTRGHAARHRYFEAIALPDEQVIGPPASPVQVAHLESQLKRSLPPSYRAFLLQYGQWLMIDGGVDLLPVADLLPGPAHERIDQWQSKMAAAGDHVAARSLVIGVSAVTATKYLLDPSAQQPDGEWALLQHHHGVEAELPSFLAWLEESADEYNELADDPT